MNIADLREGVTSGSFGTTEGEEFVPSVARPAPFLGTRSETRRYLAEGIYTLNDWEIAARATLNHQSLESYKDLDRSPYWGPLFAGVFQSGELQRWSDHSYEARVTSPQDQPLRTTAGVYYFRADNTSYQREFTGFCNRLEYGMPEINGQRSWTLNADKENKAVFGGVAYDIQEDVTLEVEGRYAKDSPTQHAANGVSCVDQLLQLHAPGNAYLETHRRPQPLWTGCQGQQARRLFLRLFRRSSNTHRPGSTTEAIENGDAIIKEENAWTYEIGAKTQWLDRRLTLPTCRYSTSTGPTRRSTKYATSSGPVQTRATRHRYPTTSSAMSDSPQ
jgi:outer membrane receptor protein involved in Fe transport